MNAQLRLEDEKTDEHIFDTILPTQKLQDYKKDYI